MYKKKKALEETFEKVLNPQPQKTNKMNFQILLQVTAFV